MFDVGWSEILVIAIVLIVVVGPKDLPRMLRSFGRTTSKLRAMAGDFRRQFDEALREAELGDVKDTLDSVRNLNPMNEIRKHLSPLEQAGEEVRAGLEDVMKPKASAEPVAEEPLKNGAAALPGEGVSETASVPKAGAARKTKARASKAGTKGRAAARSSARSVTASEAPNVKRAAASAPAAKAADAKPAAKPTAAKAAAKTAKKPPAAPKARATTSAKTAAAKKPAARKKTTGSAP
jgi:sec-independent protein translocase protein TatB